MTKTVNLMTMTLAAGLLASTAIVAPANAAGPTVGYDAVTAWAISRVDGAQGAPQGSGYCTMAQKFNGDVVLNVAQNRQGQLSLAADFQQNKFDLSKEYKATVQIGNDKAQNFTIKPQSNQAIVVGLGADKSFVEGLKAGAPLTISLNGDAYKFNTSRFGDGVSQLNTCLASFDTAPAAAKPVQEAKATPAVKPQNIEPASGPAQDSNGPPALAQAPVQPAPVTPSIPAAQLSEAEALRMENARLKEALSQSRQAFENNTMSGDQSPAVAELNEKIRMLEEQNVKLQRAAAGGAPAAAPSSAPAADPNVQAQIKTLESENASLKAALNEANTKASQLQGSLNASAGASAETAKLQADLAAAQKDRDALKASLQSAEQKVAQLSTAQAGGQADSQALASLKQENADLKRAVQKSTDDINRLQTALKSSGSAQQASAGIQTELSTLQRERDQLKSDLQSAQQKIAALETAGGNNKPLQDEIAFLKTENARLLGDLKSAQTQPADSNVVALQQQIASLESQNQVLLGQITEQRQQAAAISATPMASTGDGFEDEPLRKQVRTLRGEVEVLTAENGALKQQVESVSSAQDNKQLQLASNNWDLEQATRRYQEAQREIRRLGTQLSMQKAQCEQQKKEIEYMLFDPAVADRAQIAMLGSLEDQLAQSTKKIADMEQQLSKVSVDSAKVEQLASISQQLKDSEVKIADLQSKLAQASGAQSQVATLQSQLSEKDGKLKQLETQIAQISASKAQVDQAEAAKIADLQKQLSDKLAQVDAVKAQAGQAEAARLAELQAQLNEKIAQAAAADAKAKALETQVAQLAAKEVQIQTLQQQVVKAERAAATAITNASIAKLEPSAGTPSQAPVALQPNMRPETILAAESRIIEPAAAPKVAPAQEKTIGQVIDTVTAPQSAQPAAQATVGQDIASRALAEVKAEASAVEAQRLQKQDLAAQPPQEVMPMAAVPAAAPVAAQIAASPSRAAFKTPQDFANILSQAKIPVRGNIQPVNNLKSPDFAAYRWQTSSLFGSAEQRMMPSQGNFQSAIDQYISRAKSRCKGDFAAVPSSSGAGNTSGYEIACVSTNAGSSASLLFTWENGVFTTIAHEGRAESMDAAIDIRDKLEGVL